MTKKEIIFAIIMFILIFSMLAIATYFILNTKTPTSNLADNTENVITNSNVLASEIPTTGNDTIIFTDTKTKLRIINEYDTSFFTAKKNLLIMFGSWCPNCQEEILEIESILDYYKDDKDVNIILIAHEFNNSNYPLEDITTLVEEKVNFGDVEVFVDFNRIIRGTIDPEASTVPISYVVDKNGKILAKHDTSLTLEKAKEMLK